MFESLYIVMTVIGIVSLIAFGFILVSGFKRSVLWGLAVLLVPFAVLVYAYKYWAEVKKPFLVYAACSVLSIGLVFMMFTEMGGMRAIEMAQKIEDGTLTEQEAAQFMVSNMEMMQEMGVDSQAEIMVQMQADPNVSDEDMKQMGALFQQIEDVASGKKASITDRFGESVDEAESSADDMLEQLRRQAEQNLQAEQAVAAEPEPVKPLVPMPTYVESPIKAPVEQAKVALRTTGTVAVSEARDYLGKMMMVTTESGTERRATLLNVERNKLEFQRRAYGGSLTFKLRPDEIKSMELF